MILSSIFGGSITRQIPLSIFIRWVPPKPMSTICLWIYDINASAYILFQHSANASLKVLDKVKWQRIFDKTLPLKLGTCSVFLNSYILESSAFICFILDRWNYFSQLHQPSRTDWCEGDLARWRCCVTTWYLRQYIKHIYIWMRVHDH